jgi:hypothetical protein
VPAAVLAAVGLGALVPTLGGASVPPGLRAQTAKNLLADVATAKAPQLSGALSWTANLGLSDLSSLEESTGQSGGGGNGFDPLTLLSGDFQLKVWLGANAEHLSLIEPGAQEVDVVRNHNQAWLWDSSTQSVLHVIGAAPAAHSTHVNGTTGTKVSSTRTAGTNTASPALTPMELASQLLSHLSASTSVTIGAPLYVAGQPAYQLLIGPKGALGSTIRNIGIAIGATGPMTGVPLQVAIYAKGLASPALELGFTGLTVGAPAASELTFTPPPGSTVTTRTIGSGSAGLGASLPYSSLTRFFGSANAYGTTGSSKVGKSGKGWATVLSGPAGQTLGSVAAGPLSAVTTVVTVHGQQGRLFSTDLLNVLLMPNGRFYAGFVTPSVLEAAASANT